MKRISFLFILLFSYAAFSDTNSAEVLKKLVVTLTKSEGLVPSYFTSCDDEHVSEEKELNKIIDCIEKEILTLKFDQVNFSIQESQCKMNVFFDSKNSPEEFRFKIISINRSIFVVPYTFSGKYNLGGGGEAEVYKVYPWPLENSADRWRALKVFNDPQGAQQENKIYQYLKAPVVGDDQHLLMPFYPQTLAHHRENKELSKKYLNQVALALQEFHLKGIVHRDLKELNILTSGQNAVIADFGFAEILEPSPDGLIHTRLLGSPGYMDPTLFQAEKVAGKTGLREFTTAQLKHADAYSLAFLSYVQLYEYDLIESCEESSENPYQMQGCVERAITSLELNLQTEKNSDPLKILLIKQMNADRAQRLSPEDFIQEFIKLTTTTIMPAEDVSREESK